MDLGISGLPVIVVWRSGRCKVALFFRDFFHPFRKELWSYNHDDGIHLHTVRKSSRPCVCSLVLSRLQCLASFCVLSFRTRTFSCEIPMLGCDLRFFKEFFLGLRCDPANRLC